MQPDAQPVRAQGGVGGRCGLAKDRVLDPPAVDVVLRADGVDTGLLEPHP